ncbi:MAG: hypothetical protein K6A93_11810 [Bacteroidaceae bacterium]|nr:hypothetical protein [Bacteroidaceae bacterium]
MKKIMFSDRYGLTQAVLEGRKTMTRRLMTMTLHKKNGKEMTPVVPDDMFIASDGTAYFQVGRNGYMVPKKNQPAYHVGEEIAIAQSYHMLNKSGFVAPEWLDHTCESSAGYENKMFVRADLMPHRIRITNIKVERLQDISEMDILREGVYFYNCGIDYGYTTKGLRHNFPTARDAFAALIDKVSGKGTWKRNPWVFAYGFELVR